MKDINDAAALFDWTLEQMKIDPRISRVAGHVRANFDILVNEGWDLEELQALIDGTFWVGLFEAAQSASPSVVEMTESQIYFTHLVLTALATGEELSMEKMAWLGLVALGLDDQFKISRRKPEQDNMWADKVSHFFKLETRRKAPAKLGISVRMPFPEKKPNSVFH